MPTELAHAVVRLTDQTRALLALMHFEPIPAEANFIAFFEDGHAAFMEELKFDGVLMPAIPQMTMISYYKNIQLDLQY